jgi:anti-sigma-K factor RskA
MGVSAHRAEHLELCAGLVLGSLDEVSRAEIERHLGEGCAECEAELLQLSEGSLLLAASAPPVAPPPALRARVLERVAREGVARGTMPSARLHARPASTVRIERWVGFAAAAALIVVAITSLRTSQRLQSEVASTRKQLAEQQRQLADQQQKLAEEQRWSALLEQSATRVVDLGLTPQGTAVLRARAIVDPGTRRAIIVFTNFTPPAGADYQLWALRDGKPESLGLVHADASGRAMVRIDDIGDPAHLQAFAVSLEKAGGSHSAGPEGPVVMLGKLGS